MHARSWWRSALAAVMAAGFPARAWDGPTQGPLAQPGHRVVFIASDAGNGGVTGVFRGFEEAAARLGWKAEFQDGGGSPARLEALLDQARAGGADGVVLGGFDARASKARVAALRKAGKVVVGWHAAEAPGPSGDLFWNVATRAETVARLAVDYVLNDAAARNRPAGIVIFTDPRFSVARAKTEAMLRALRGARGGTPSRVLGVEQLPIADVPARMPGLVERLLKHHGQAWTHALAINDAYFDHANVPLSLGRRTDIVAVSAGDGSALALSRIAAGRSQQAATVAEPLRCQGWQLADELNRAFAGARPSGYVGSPVLVTTDLLKGRSPEALEAGLGFEAAYRRIWQGH